MKRGQENEYGIKGWIKEEMAERKRKTNGGHLVYMVLEDGRTNRGQEDE